MKRTEYFLQIKSRLANIMDINNKIHNYKGQMNADYVGADFLRTYDETFLWNNAMFLSSNSVILLNEDHKDTLALKCLKYSAEIYELFAKLSKKYDREFSNILSALCYDIAGYQANAICVLRTQELYKVESFKDEIDDNLIDLDNYILKHVQNILLKKIPEAFENIISNEDNLLYTVFNKAIRGLYSNILHGEDEDYEKYIKESIKYFNRSGNAYISQILHLLSIRIKLYSERSVRNNLKEYIDINNNIWEKYIKLLAFDMYDIHSIKKTENRVSTFEFWQSQLKAIKKGLLNEDSSSFIVQMPTSAGKTFIAELLILKKLIEEPNKKVIYIAPFRALRNQKEEELSKHLSKLGYIISTLSGDYEIDEFHESMIRNTNVLIATPEKVDLMLRLDKEYFKKVSLLVIDEGHMIGNLFKLTLPRVIDAKDLKPKNDIEYSKEEKNIIMKGYNLSKDRKTLYLQDYIEKTLENDLLKIFVKNRLLEYEVDDRANLLEFLILRLLYINDSLQVLFLSAVMPKENSQNLSKWLSKSDDKIIDGLDEFGQVWEPTRRVIGKAIYVEKSNTIYIEYPEIKVGKKNAFVPNFISEEVIKYINPKTKRINTFKFPNFSRKADICTSIAIKFINSNLGNCLVFAAKPNNVIAIATSFASYFRISENVSDGNNTFHSTETNASYFHAKMLYGEDNPITVCLKYGIGVHYGKMFESVRKSVEEDFNNNKLKCLIATNTIGQGLNFPIKHVIIHSLDINVKINKYLPVRDFWNIVGRAGRACKDTEGQIIFVTLSENDKELFKYYTNKNNVEAVDSSYLTVIRDMMKNRISNDTFTKQTSILSEPFLLDILTEEYYNEDKVIIEKICSKSLAKIQINDDEDMENMLYDSLSNNLTRIREEVKDLSTIIKFSKSGFQISGNRIISNFIDSHSKKIEEFLLTDNFEGLLRLYIDLLYLNSINEMLIERVCDISLIKKINFTNILIEWINGKPLNEINELWTKITSDINESSFEGFIEEALLYRYPWGMTAFLEQILCKFENVNIKIIPNIMNLSTFIKCGMNDPLGCYLYTLGMKSRTGIKLVCDAYKEKNQSYGYEEITKWLINLEIDEINQFGLNPHEFQDLYNVISQLTQRNIYSNDWYQVNEIVFAIKGISNNEESRELSKKLKKSDILTISRDYNNILDPYLIRLQFNGRTIGMLPSEFSKHVATEIDINDAKYDVVIKQIIPRREYNKIIVMLKMIKDI